MKIDITPNELKSIINAYQTELDKLDIRYSRLEERYYDYMTYMEMREENKKERINISKHMFKIEPRLKYLKIVYKDLLDGLRIAYFGKCCNGIRNYCKLNDLSEEDVAELLDEIESSKEL